MEEPSADGAPEAFPLDKWDVSKVTDMSGMFHFAINFNQDISGWDTSNVITMVGMFCNANMYIGYNMYKMFNGAESLIFENLQSVPLYINAPWYHE